jgi:hypothetical protein
LICADRFNTRREARYYAPYCLPHGLALLNIAKITGKGKKKIRRAGE